MTKRFRKILPNFLSMSPDRIISCRRHALTFISSHHLPTIILVQYRLGNETFFIVTVAVEWHHQHVCVCSFGGSDIKEETFLLFK